MDQKRMGAAAITTAECDSCFHVFLDDVGKLGLAATRQATVHTDTTSR